MKRFICLAVLISMLSFLLNSCSSGSKPKEFEVTFDSNGGSMDLYEIVKEGDTVEEPSKPKRKGYIFKGWYLDGEEFDFDTVITDNLTLEAKWKKCTSHSDSNSDFKCDKCRADTLNKYSTAGLTFYLPLYMQEVDVNYADYVYSSSDDSIMTKDVEIMMYFYSPEQIISDLHMQRDVTVQEYADWFMRQYDDVSIEENYDEENEVITLKYIYYDYHYSYFFFDYIVRNEYMLYHITYSCDLENRATYEPIFDELSTYIKLEY